MIGRFWRFLFPFLTMLLLLLFSTFATAQFVRSENYINEQQRRAHYALDDWISHTTSHYFSTAAIGTYYLYIATRDGGILRYHILENYWDYPFTTSNGLPSNRVLDVFYDHTTSYLWAITPNDVSIFNPASEEWISKSQTPGWNYEFPNRDTARVQPRDIDQIDRNTFFGRDALLQLPTFFANGPYSIFNEWQLIDDLTFDEFPIIGYIRDRFDRMWFLVDGFGIGQGDLFSQRVDFYRIGLPDIRPRALEYQGDDLWIGGFGSRSEGLPAIALWPYETVEWQYFQAKRISRLPSDNVNAILADGDSVWFATDYGISLYDRGRDRWRNYSTKEGLTNNLVTDLAIVNDYLYGATSQGISRINLLTGKVEKIKDRRLQNLPTNCFTLQSDTLWAGTFRGLFRLIPETGVWDFVAARAAVPDMNITAIAVYGNDLWVAGAGGIIHWNTKSDEWRSFPQVGMEIPSPYHDMRVNDKAVWIATESGLLKYDKERLDWRLFTRKDGLVSNNCRQLLLNGDYIWIVSDAGITEFYWNSPNRSD